MKKMDMKKLLLMFCVLAVLSSCDIRNTNKYGVAQPQITHKFTDSTTVQMIDSVYNFGKVTDGEKVTYNYRFTNSGTKPLIISSAMASCGCTVPEKPEEPIKPGETGSIKVVFNSSGRVGPAHKTITVVSNAYPAFPVLELTGQVVNKQ
jgi:hypothetical protein